MEISGIIGVALGQELCEDFPILISVNVFQSNSAYELKFTLQSKGE